MTAAEETPGAARGAFNEALAAQYAQQSRDAAERDAKKRRVVRVVRAPRADAEAESVAHEERPRERYADFGGIEEILAEIREIVERPFRFPGVYARLGVAPARGVLLHGPPGCGKSSLAAAIAGELGVPLLRVSAPELVAGISGESEARIRALFAQARRAAPCILFLDEVDAICPKRDGAQREMERRVVAQLLTCMDALARPDDATAELSAADGVASAHAADSSPQADAAVGEQQKQANNTNTPAGARVMVIGATNRPDALDPALRRAGRFDRELRLGVPGEAARLRILATITRPLRLDDAQRAAVVAEMARLTPGYVGADLRALCREAAYSAVRRLFSSSTCARAAGSLVSADLPMDPLSAGSPMEPLPAGLPVTHLSAGSQMEALSAGSQINLTPAGSPMMTPLPAGLQSPPESASPTTTTLEDAPRESDIDALCIGRADFVAALARVQPAVKREGFATVPGCRWSDVGALQGVRRELRMAVVEPMRHPEVFRAAGVTAPAGVLLWGPPGCGKTLLARAVAAEAAANFLSVKGPELLSRFVGDSERAVRTLFERARQSAPCVVFFDEIDALCPRRDAGADGGSEVAARVVNQMLTEMDGVDGGRAAGVYVLAATNRPDMVDPAMTRPGRLDRCLYVPLPDAAERGDILRTLGRATPWAADVDLDAIAADPRCDGFSGADLSCLVRESALAAIRAVLPSHADADDEMAVDSFGGSVVVTRSHVEEALARVRPSVSRSDLQRYLLLHSKLANAGAR